MLKEERTSFLKKRSKKLLHSCARVASGADRRIQKFFASFFQKRSSFFLISLVLAAAAPTDATVQLTTQPGSALETIAAQLSADDLKQSRASGDAPVLLVGSARLAADRSGPAALFVQVQSAAFCGSAGCSTSVYLRRAGAWTKILDSISGPIKVSPRIHGGMHDLLVHGHDRFVWTGTAYADTLPVPEANH
jgi:hypothetical protein